MTFLEQKSKNHEENIITNKINFLKFSELHYDCLFSNKKKLKYWPGTKNLVTTKIKSTAMKIHVGRFDSKRA